MQEIQMPIVVVIVVSCVAAVTDIWRFKVANVLTLSLFASGLIYHAIVSGWPGFSRSALGAAFGFIALILPYAARGMGAGDVKLLTGVGAWLGLPMTYDVLIAAAIAGGVYALILTMATGRLRKTLSDVQRLIARGAVPAEVPLQDVLSRGERRRHLVPFAAMVTVGVLVTIARS